MADEPIPLDAETREVIRLLRAAAARCMKIMRNPPGGTEKGRAFAASRAAQQLAGINRELDAVKGKLAKVAAKKIAGAYQAGLDAGERQARAAGVVAGGSGGGAFKGGFSVVDRRRAQVLAQQTVGDLSKAVESIKATTGKVVRQTQALGLDNKAVNTLLAGGTIQGAPRQTLRELKKLMQAAAIEGKIVTVNTQTGEARYFKPDFYAEMVYQTKLAETTNIATLHRLQQKKMFYVKIIGSNSRNFCTAFVGRVFYTGDSNDPLGLFPHVRQLPRGGPPFHPRCTKRYTAFIPKLATPEQMKAAKLKPGERELLGKSGSAAQRQFEKTLPPPSKKAAPSPLAAKRPASTKPTAKPSYEPVLMDIKDQAIAESAARASDLVKQAGYTPPAIWRDNPDVFNDKYSRDALASYSARDDAVFINPKSPHWKNVAEVMKKLFKQGQLSTSHQDHPNIHEIGHFVHRHGVGLARYTEIRGQRFTKDEQALVMKYVSSYAATEPVELIAEVFTIKIVGREVPAEVLTIYRRFGGP